MARSLAYGRIRSNDRTVDDVLLLIMRAPHSYTREDVVEIQCHGGHISAKRVLEAVLNQGVRLAEPGEFTKRAFLNGRIDLLQAEAVLDLVRAQSERSAQGAIEQLEGKLSTSFNDIYDKIIWACADLEATLDFADDDTPPRLVADIILQLQSIQDQIIDLLKTWDEGHLLREGALVVISGRPNVGKSTLLNALLGKNRAIVSPIPGTTRDTIEETIILSGIPIRLVDTAGLRSTTCEIEQEGVLRATSHMKKADLHLYVIDASQSLSNEDLTTLQGLDHWKTVVVLNKTDLGTRIVENAIAGYRFVYSQLTNGKGLIEIQECIEELLGSTYTGVQRAAISTRHKKILDNSLSEVNRAISILKSTHDDATVLAASHLRYASEFIGQINGKVYHDELLESVFSRFCLGK